MDKPELVQEIVDALMDNDGNYRFDTLDSDGESTINIVTRDNEKFQITVTEID